MPRAEYDRLAHARPGGPRTSARCSAATALGSRVPADRCPMMLSPTTVGDWSVSWARVRQCQANLPGMLGFDVARRSDLFGLPAVTPVQQPRQAIRRVSARRILTFSFGKLVNPVRRQASGVDKPARTACRRSVTTCCPWPRKLITSSLRGRPKTPQRQCRDQAGSTPRRRCDGPREIAPHLRQRRAI